MVQTLSKKEKIDIDDCIFKYRFLIGAALKQGTHKALGMGKASSKPCLATSRPIAVSNARVISSVAKPTPKWPESA
jgi:hypothetical protein